MDKDELGFAFIEIRHHLDDLSDGEISFLNDMEDKHFNGGELTFNEDKKLEQIYKKVVH